MNKVNYLALGSVALAIISICLPWVEVSVAGGAADLNQDFQQITVHGISIGYGIFGLLVMLTGGYLVLRESKWTFIAGIVGFIDGYGYLHEWFGKATRDSANYGDVTSRSSVDPKFGLYLFVLASLAFIVFTLKYYKLKKTEAALHSVQNPKEAEQQLTAPTRAAASQNYQPSKIQPMTTSSSETPTGPVPTEAAKEPVKPAETTPEQPEIPVAAPDAAPIQPAETLSEPVTPVAEEPVAAPRAPEPVTPTVPVPPVEVPKPPVQAVVPEPEPVYQAPRASAAPQPQYVEPEKKKSSNTWIFVILLLIALVGAGVFIMTNNSSQKSKDKTEQAINDEKARLQVIINEVNQDVSDKKYDDALLKINSINWLYEPGANKDYVDQYNSQRENLRNTIDQLKSNQSMDDQQQAADKAKEAGEQQVQSGDSIH